MGPDYAHAHALQHQIAMLERVIAEFEEKVANATVEDQLHQIKRAFHYRLRTIIQAKFADAAARVRRAAEGRA